MSYILIPRIEISGANAQSAYSIVSGPSPLAFMGFARKLFIDLNGGDVTESDQVEVAILHHDLEMRGEQFFHFHPWQIRGGSLTSSNNGTSSDYVSGTKSMSLQPLALCNLTASLIISGIDGFGEQEIENAVQQMRIAGGQIQRCGKIVSYTNFSDIRIGNGFFIKDRNDLLSDVPAEKKMSVFLKVLHESKQPKSQFPWLLPMNLGYLPVTPFTEKKSARGQFPHAYAEPLVGLIQYVSPRQLQEQKKGIPFWRYTRDGNAFVVKSCK
jgi:CRISPR-associated protein Csy2